MAAKNVATLIKEARTNAGLTQAGLAAKVDDCTASDISKAERGEKQLTQAQLKQIAKATGVTQSSLINAPKAKKKTSSSSSSSSASSSLSSSSSSKKTTSVKLTATEKKLVELYRAASTDVKKSAMNVLKGEESTTASLLSNIVDGAVSGIFGKKSMPTDGDEDSDEEAEDLADTEEDQ